MSGALFSIKLFDFQMSLGNAALIALLGILIVFAVLAVLVGILTLFKLIFNIKITKKPTVADSGNTTAANGSSDEDYDELVAVISAAIACMNEEEQVKAPFVIKSINKIK